MRVLRILRAYIYIWHITVKYRQYRYAVKHPVRSLYFAVAGTLITLDTLVLSIGLWTGYLHH